MLREVLFISIIAAPLYGVTGVANHAVAPTLVFESGGEGPRVFTSRSPGFQVLITGEGLTVHVPHRQSRRLQFVGTSGAATLHPKEPTGGTSSYFLGDDVRRRGVPHFRKVLASAVWPGIDVVYYGKSQTLEYDFVVHPGADTSLIRMQWDAGEQPRLTGTGDITVGPILMKRPEVYQEMADGRHIIRAWYVVQGQEVRVRVADYDQRAALIIDPEIVAAATLGGAENDRVNKMILDAAGNILLTGRTESPNFPVSPGAVGTVYHADTDTLSKGDIFVMKLDPSGQTVLFSTFLGGTRSDEGIGLAINSRGNIIVVGRSTSNDFPVTAGVAQTKYGGGTANDVVVAALTSDGATLLFSTYIGGTGGDTAAGMAIGPDDGIHVLMNTNNPAYPTTPGAFRQTTGATAMVVKLAPDASRVVFASSLGLGGYFLGLASAPVGGGSAIAVDKFGHSFVCGVTVSGGVQATPGAYQTQFGGATDGFVLRLNELGNEVVYSTLLGGAGDDQCVDILVDDATNAYITGRTASGNSFGAGPVHGTPDSNSRLGYVARLPVFGNQLDSVVYVANANPLALCRGSDERIIITGFTTSDNFPTTPNAPDRNHTGDAIVSQFHQDGKQLLFSTYFGRKGITSGTTIAIGAFGTVYVAGNTDAADFPVTSGAISGSPLGKADIFLTQWRFDFQ